MNQINRLWVAAGVSVLNGHSDQGQKLIKSGLKSLKHCKKHSVSSGGDAADLRPISGVLSSDVGGFLVVGGGVEEKRRQSEDSLRQVMYLSCWGQS
ncbi:hypothetical protein CASFOL_008118 [Castilleja foliolosa]|uniref:Uncharacterized protein n=1 Tax=Castilleja foliolosa TaxID=1961234 RepID=A0ABD3DY17_9LAMI